MGDVTEYYATLPADVRELFDGMRRRALELVPDAVEGRSYGMPALLYRGKGLLSTMQAKTHLAVYPFSGTVVGQVADRLPGFSLSSGTIRFSVDHPLPAEVVDDLIELRVREIDGA
ncbi:DUF1801 domain-containing protein [Planctomonas sp. JC2975]|uniref:iron chaperone n=1 Tax=Planctomonas sp. JC2975 TaxID=2729626 RepID=UPI001475F7B0|nr:DUF1801 domain-containing protein [Planctomonas sp. JC2975]NNC13947.1 DUF1801 domain-containing protein [Planctomonas sp. JC2975]